MRKTGARSGNDLRLDAANECVWRDAERLKLTPKAFSVLQHLATHAGQLVTKEELFDAVWGETVVSEAALTKCIREVRRVLGDNAKQPQYIETVHRRGFRFIAAITTASPQGLASSV